MDNTYVVEALTNTTSTVEIADDGAGIDTLTSTGVYEKVVEFTLAWTVSGDQPSAASVIYFLPTGGGGFEGHRLIVTGVIENATGGVGRDFIQGNVLGNVLWGDASLAGLGLGDTLWGGSGNDTIHGGTGDDEILGDGDNDRLFGEAGIDSISGGGGVDTIDGGTGADVLAGGGTVGDMLSYALSTAAVQVTLEFGTTTTCAGGDAEGDRVTGFSDVTGTFWGDRIEDLVKGTLAFGYNDNAFWGGKGRDALILGGGDDRGFGGDGDGTIEGEAGNDRASGDAGADLLSGGSGRDRLTGGAGGDTLTGGGGADLFILASAGESTGAALDQITDFRAGQGDRFDLRLVDAILGGTDDAFVFRGTKAFTGAGQVRLEVGVDGVTVQGNLDTDAAAEFAIFVAGATGLAATDFLL